MKNTRNKRQTVVLLDNSQLLKIRGGDSNVEGGHLTQGDNRPKPTDPSKPK